MADLFLLVSKAIPYIITFLEPISNSLPNSCNLILSIIMGEVLHLNAQKYTCYGITVHVSQNNMNINMCTLCPQTTLLLDYISLVMNPLRKIVRCTLCFSNE